MDRVSEYVRCVHFTYEDTLYIATNHGYLCCVTLSAAGNIKWPKLAHVGEKGGEGDCFYVVGSREFEVLTTHEENNGAVTKVCQMYTAEKLHSFRELALMSNKPHQASVCVVSRETLWALQREDFRGILMSASSNLSSLKMLRSVEFLAKLSILQLSYITNPPFAFRELAAATKNFVPEYFLREGRFGRVYTGMLESSGWVVAVKQLDRNRLPGHVNSNDIPSIASTISFREENNAGNADATLMLCCHRKWSVKNATVLVLGARKMRQDVVNNANRLHALLISNGFLHQTCTDKILGSQLVNLNDGGIVSSSVDCTLTLWKDDPPIEFWEAHKAAIQTVVKLPSGELVTGSSDATLKLGKGKTCVRTFSGHTDLVRGLAMMVDLGILFVSHDGSIRLWALSSAVLMEMVGHTSLVHSVDSHKSGLILNGSEDCSAKIWKDGACIQRIEHPGHVWDAPFLENSDMVTACSDGIVRLWLTHYDKITEESEQEALQIPGTSNDQTKIVREVDNGVTYSWNRREHMWDKTGEVVDGPNDADQFDGILKKIIEFNNALQLDPAKRNLSLAESGIAKLGTVVEVLKDTSHYHSTTLTAINIALLLKLLKTWSVAIIFPVIDILRIVALHPDGANLLLKHEKNGKIL